MIVSWTIDPFRIASVGQSAVPLPLQTGHPDTELITGGMGSAWSQSQLQAKRLRTTIEHIGANIRHQIAQHDHEMVATTCHGQQICAGGDSAAAAAAPTYSRRVVALDARRGHCLHGAGKQKRRLGLLIKSSISVQRHSTNRSVEYAEGTRVLEIQSAKLQTSTKQRQPDTGGEVVSRIRQLHRLRQPSKQAWQHRAAASNSTPHRCSAAATGAR